MASEPAPPAPAASNPARRIPPAWAWILVAAAAALVAVRLANRLVARPGHLGPVDGRLAECPESPNCVSSQCEDSGHRVEPLPAEAPAARSLPRLRQLLEGRAGVTLVAESPHYLHYEFRTLLCRFVDDVEFLADEEKPVIHVRSASRIGYSDLGANRRRIEALRREWRALAKPGPAPE